jgi:hypothetical protein
MGGTGRNTGQEAIKRPVKREIYAQIGNVKYTREDSNLQPSVPKTDALSN